MKFSKAIGFAAVASAGVINRRDDPVLDILSQVDYATRVIIAQVRGFNTTTAISMQHLLDADFVPIIESINYAASKLYSPDKALSIQEATRLFEPAEGFQSLGASLHAAYSSKQVAIEAHTSCFITFTSLAGLQNALRYFRRTTFPRLPFEVATPPVEEFQSFIRTLGQLGQMFASCVKGQQIYY
ncbi:hypothetical protein DCS_04759 [Drechmeria coniospora]|uniref:Uncharacterized protein n=1 Tax=Drechmeria coniospora TaxID=98403 RepID=A0A151GKX8_DRECN|nr:hypothetical protein DCS_04759 [Drechmeria coniospora]KYK57746.1 hypothetical protein DCS_04759 [Drechmeria coniospora]ODA79634.1 hypothetical protein RJ55_05228 [Drechmeria coniospora]